MAYKALYRTYRPQKFSEVIGQKVIVKTLQNAILSGKISHAYLFSGPRGTGKTTIARIFAKALNCENAPTSDPCGKCRSCLEIAEGNNPDVIEIDAASNNGVDEIRDIRDKVKFLPGGSKYKVYIIDEVHMLSSGAFNALLKTLEEPPKHVVFILATTEPHKVLPTILSRCQRFDFKSLTVKEISKMVIKVAEEEKIKISEEAVIAISESADGGLRDALSYLDQAISFSDEEVTVDDVNNVTGNLGSEKIIELVTYIEAKNIDKALKIINELVNLGKEINKLITGLLQFYRDVLLYKSIDTANFSKYIFEKEDFKKLAELLNADRIFYYVDVLNDVQSKIKFSNTPQIFFEIAIIKMVNITNHELDLLKRVASVEEKIDIIDGSSNGQSQQAVDIDDNKIHMIENSLSRVISELSKLELPKLIDRVNSLEDSIDNKTTNTDLIDRIIKLEESINVKSNKNDNNADVEGSLNDFNLETLKEDIKKFVDQKLLEIQDSLKNITASSNFDENTNFEINEIKDKIVNIEEKLYRLISGALSNQPSVIKKTKKKVNAGQVVFVGNEITTVSELEKSILKDKIDFDKIQKETINSNIEIKQDKRSTNDETCELEIIDEDNNIIDEQNNENEVSHQEVNDEDAHQNEVIENEFVIELPKDNEHNIEILQNDNSNDEYSFDQTSDEINKEIEEIFSNKTENKKLNNEFVKIIEDEEKTIIDKPNSQIVTIKHKDDDVTRGLYIVDSENNESKDENLKINDTSLNDENIIQESLNFNEQDQVENENDNSNDLQINIPNDEDFSSYSEKVIERILNDSRKPEARNDKARITNLWKVISHNVSADDLSIADILRRGQITAVGNKEFILVYDNPTICNQVMSHKFKNKSLKILYDLLGETYNYMALPNEIWLMKRSEYVNQYNIGIKYPTLTPINDPSLKVITEQDDNKFMNNKEKMIATAYEMFGDIVKIE